MSFEIDGLDNVLENISAVSDNTDKLEAAIVRACLLVERSAKQKAPKGNGDLARSISSKVETSGSEVIGTVFTPLFYAPYVEYGTGLFAEAGNGRKDVPWHYQDDEGEWHTTSGMKPQPFMRPALNENREQIIRMLEDAKND